MSQVVKAAEIDEVTLSLPPSHILQDGRFIHLPPPTEKEHRMFFERTIARHGLLEEDLGGKKATEEEEEAKKEMKIHPLALASARLQGDGFNELNRAINLSSLVMTGEYFGMSNIVDPSLEVAPTTTTTTSSTEKSSGETDAAAKTASTAPTSQTASALEVQEEQRIKSSYILKRKKSQFVHAATVLGRHRKRLTASIVAQSLPDQRLRQLRPQWRLVAPEHGTRALPHATRPSEVIACDVDVYLKSGAVLGQLARRVPRYATIDLNLEYSLKEDLGRWSQRFDGDSMEIDETDKPSETATTEYVPPTTAEPFAIADPSLGKLDADFDPKKVPMLLLQFDIEKASTNFLQSAVLEAPSYATGKSKTFSKDESVLFSLQHSLFCAKLFESIRRELAPDTEEVGSVRTSKSQSVVWLSGESETNFLPPPSYMSGSLCNDMAQLCVIHCHEGEVKVQLDCEYTLRVKLVEEGESDKVKASVNLEQSGSFSPDYLHTLCRVLLFHAQERYHDFSAKAAERMTLQEEGEKSNPGLFKRKSEEVSPHILQACASLGSKMLFEKRIRQVLVNVNKWLKSKAALHSEEAMLIEWLPLSVFDSYAMFTLTFRSFVIDAHISCEELTVTSTSYEGDYRKVKFNSDAEFELYLQLALQRVIRDST